MESAERLGLVIALILAALCASAGLTGCNTVEGVGEDVEAGGERLQDAADNE